jgi:hypothetical protein
MAEEEKQTIEKEIERARDAVGVHIDELDHKLRRTLDVNTFASQHAEQLMVGGAVVGFLVGFGFPKPLMRVMQLGVPLGLFAYKFMKSHNGAGGVGREI